jgi:hypothetical protein
MRQSQHKTSTTKPTHRVLEGSDKYKIAEILRFGTPNYNPQVAAARRTLCGGVADAEGKVAMAAIRAALPAAAVKEMVDYTPDLPAEYVAQIRAFVEDAVSLALPHTPYAAEALMRPTIHFVYWAVFVVGAEQDATVIFQRELIEHYVRETISKRTEGTRRNYRACLFRVAEAVNPEANPRNPMPLNQRALDTPYTSDELAVLDGWAAGQSSAYSRRAATTLIALGGGAGLSSREITHLRAESVTVGADNSVTIHTTEGRPRDIPVAARYENALAKAVKGLSGELFVFLPKRTRTENDVVSAFVARTSRPTGTPTVRVQRLRNTWLVHQMANRVDVLTLMEAAGLKSLESISRLASFVPRPSDQERIEQLRGTK